jgi:hypothetical protein
MQSLSWIAIQKGFVKLFWLSASHLLSKHAENLQVDLFLDLETFFSFLFTEIDRNLAFVASASHKRGCKNVQTQNQKVLK